MTSFRVNDYVKVIAQTADRNGEQGFPDFRLWSGKQIPSFASNFEGRIGIVQPALEDVDNGFVSVAFEGENMSVLFKAEQLEKLEYLSQEWNESEAK